MQSRKNPSLFYQSVRVCEKCYIIYKSIDTKRSELYPQESNENEFDPTKNTSGHYIQAKRKNVSISKTKLSQLAKPKFRNKKRFTKTKHSILDTIPTHSKKHKDESSMGVFWNQSMELQQSQQPIQANVTAFNKVNELEYIDSMQRQEAEFHQNNQLDDTQNELNRSVGQCNGWDPSYDVFAQASLNSTFHNYKIEPDEAGPESSEVIGYTSMHDSKETMKRGKCPKRNKKISRKEQLIARYEGTAKAHIAKRKQTKHKKHLRHRTEHTPASTSPMQIRDKTFRTLVDLEIQQPGVYQILKLLALGKLKDSRRLVGLAKERGVTSLAFAKLSEEGKIILEYDWSSSIYQVKVQEFNSSKKGRWVYNLLERHMNISKALILLFTCWFDVDRQKEQTIKEKVVTPKQTKIIQDAIAGLQQFASQNPSASNRIPLFEAMEDLISGNREKALDKLNESLGKSTRSFGLWSHDVGISHFLLGKYMSVDNPEKGETHLSAAEQCFKTGDRACDEELKATEMLLFFVKQKCRQLKQVGLTTHLHNPEIKPTSKIDLEVSEDNSGNTIEPAAVISEFGSNPAIEQYLPPPVALNRNSNENLVEDEFPGFEPPRPSTAIRDTIKWGQRSIAASKRRLHHEKLLPEYIQLTGAQDPTLRKGSMQVQRAIDAAEAIVRKLDNEVHFHGLEHRSDSFRPMSVHTLERNMVEIIEKVSVQTKSLLDMTKNRSRIDVHPKTENMERNNNSMHPNASQMQHTTGLMQHLSVAKSQQDFHPTKSMSDSSSEEEYDNDSSDDEVRTQNKRKQSFKERKIEEELIDRNEAVSQAEMAHQRQEVNELGERRLNGGDYELLGEERNVLDVGDQNVLDVGAHNMPEISDQNLSDIDQIFYACKNQDVEMLERISHSTDIKNCVNSESNTILHVAAEEGWVEGIHFGLSKGIDINAQNMEGNTALHLANSKREMTVELLLVALGANVELTNIYGLTYDQGERVSAA